MKLYPNISAFFCIWFICIMVISFFGFNNFPHSENFKLDFIANLANWDGGHFLSIAEHGYIEKYQYAFFPLYPLLIHLVNNITHNYLTAALIISISFAFLIIHLLYGLVSLDFDKKIAQKVILSLLLFPTSFYLVTVYSESLFLFFTLAAFFSIRKNSLVLATIFAALASGTRLIGLAVGIGLLVEILTTGGFSRKNWYVVFSFSGFLIYCIYLYKIMGDPFYFLTAEQHWQRSLTIPVFGFWETIKSLSQSGFIANHFNVFLDLIFAVFGTGVVLRTFRFLPPSYSVYSLISILLPLFTPTLSSMPRFLLPIFPIFILLAFIKKDYLTFAYQLISILLLSAFAILFINGYWVS